ncbi:MAG: ABC transporter ATP-binding protein [Candidatus Thermoplasmatota archaeon]|nr:ABC transporter ATP-binding protein [Candidatus Thermoplasmatota archaeon]
MIEARDVHFSYGPGPPVLKGVDLKVERGTIMGIVGPNGCGKSTLLGCLGGVRRPDRGRVLLDGKDVRHMRRRDLSRIVSTLPQDASYGFDYTVEEIVSMGRYPHMNWLEMSGGVHKGVVRRALSGVGALQFSGRAFSELSGGEKQKVNLARILAQETDYALLDEPTRDLDLKSSLDLLDLIKRENMERGLTFIVVMHDLMLALRTFKEIAMMKAGRIKAIGGADSVLTPGWIKDTFGVDVEVDHHNGVLRILG